MACGLLVDLNLVSGCQSQQRLSFFHQSYHTVGIIFSIPYKTPTSPDSLDYEELLLGMKRGRSRLQLQQKIIFLPKLSYGWHNFLNTLQNTRKSRFT